MAVRQVADAHPGLGASELADVVAARIGIRPAPSTVQAILAQEAAAAAERERRRQERAALRVPVAIRKVSRETGLSCAQVAAIAAATYRPEKDL
jgi:hypothetical protein